MDSKRIWFTVSESLRQFIGIKIKDPQTVDDLLQEVFLKVQENSRQLKDEEKAGAWVFRIAQNTITDHYRRLQRPEIEGWKNLTSPAPDDASDLTAEFAGCIPAMLEVLPPIYREALYLSEIEGLSQKELAQRLGISYSGAKSRVQRGREKLREILLECCHIHTDVYGNIIDYHKK